MRVTLPPLLLALTLGFGCSNATQASESPAQPAIAPAAARQPTAAAPCGGAGLADCPLQQWMKATLQTYQRAGNYDRIARSMQELRAHAPAGFDGWADLAARGAAAAQKQDAAALRQVCKDCHETQRARYRRERRAQPLF
jgi:hypothetical protein